MIQICLCIRLRWDATSDIFLSSFPVVQQVLDETCNFWFGFLQGLLFKDVDS
jgi:hypothetical protein